MTDFCLIVEDRMRGKAKEGGEEFKMLHDLANYVALRWTAEDTE